MHLHLFTGRRGRVRPPNLVRVAGNLLAPFDLRENRPDRGIRCALAISTADPGSARKDGAPPGVTRCFDRVSAGDPRACGYAAELRPIPSQEDEAVVKLVDRAASV